MNTPLDQLPIFRMINVDNLYFDLQNGLHCKNNGVFNPQYRAIGNNEIIDRRGMRIVDCFPGTFVNDYVPFYFSVRTPMLFNIMTGYGVASVPQEDIIYLGCRLIDLTMSPYKWCYTNGNAAMKITKFYTNLTNIANNIDWKSIYSNDFRANNSDGDEDRTRKKHAEFLVKNHVPHQHILAIHVYNNRAKARVEAILEKANILIPVFVNPQFYF